MIPKAKLSVRVVISAEKVDEVDSAGGTGRNSAVVNCNPGSYRYAACSNRTFSRHGFERPCQEFSKCSRQLSHNKVGRVVLVDAVKIEPTINGLTLRSFQHEFP